MGATTQGDLQLYPFSANLFYVFSWYFLCFQQILSKFSADIFGFLWFHQIEILLTIETGAKLCSFLVPTEESAMTWLLRSFIISIIKTFTIQHVIILYKLTKLRMRKHFIGINIIFLQVEQQSADDLIDGVSSSENYPPPHHHHHCHYRHCQQIKSQRTHSRTTMGAATTGGKTQDLDQRPETLRRCFITS